MFSSSCCFSAYIWCCLPSAYCLLKQVNSVAVPCLRKLRTDYIQCTCTLFLAFFLIELVTEPKTVSFCHAICQQVVHVAGSGGTPSSPTATGLDESEQNKLNHCHVANSISDVVVSIVALNYFFSAIAFCFVVFTLVYSFFFVEVFWVPLKCRFVFFIQFT